MKYLFVITLYIGFTWVNSAQTVIEKEVAVSTGAEVYLDFTHPKLIQVKTWDQPTVKLIASVSINKGQNDEAFEFVADEGEQLFISSKIANYDLLPKKVLIRYQDTDVFFDTDDPNDQDIQDFKRRIKEGAIHYSQHGVITEINIQVFVPNDIALSIESKFGMVEVFDTIEDLKINAVHGGADISFSNDQDINIAVETRFGEVYSNLNRSFKGGNNNQPMEWNFIISETQTATNNYDLRSEFGYVYLRKAQ